MARVVASIDRKQELGLLPYTDSESSALLASVPLKRQTLTWWLVLSDRKLLPGNNGGSTAVLKIITLTRWIGQLISFLHLEKTLNAIDRYFAVKRSSLSDYVPEGPAPRRFP